MATSAHVYEHPVTRIRVEDVPGLPADIEAELARGARVELVSGDRVVGELRAPESNKPQLTAATFDFAAQRREMWGDRVFDVDTTQWIREDRDARG